MRSDRTGRSRAAAPVFTTLWLVTLAACGSGSRPQYQIRTLSSGRTLKVLGERRISFPQSGPALMLQYQTDVPLADTAALRAEAADVWRDYQARADSAGVQGAILSANMPPSGGLVSHSGGFNFVYRRGPAGEWRAAR